MNWVYALLPSNPGQTARIPVRWGGACWAITWKTALSSGARVLYYLSGDLARHYPEVVHHGRLEGCRNFSGKLRAMEETGSGISGMRRSLLSFCP